LWDQWLSAGQQSLDIWIDRVLMVGSILGFLALGGLDNSIVLKDFQAASIIAWLVLERRVETLMIRRNTIL